MFREMAEQLSLWRRRYRRKRFMLSLFHFTFAGHFLVLGIILFVKHPTLSTLTTNWLSGPISMMLAVASHFWLTNYDSHFWNSGHPKWNNWKSKTLLSFIGLVMAFNVFYLYELVNHFSNSFHSSNNSTRFETVVHYSMRIYPIGNVTFMNVSLFAITLFLMKYKYLTSRLEQITRCAENFRTPGLVSKPISTGDLMHEYVECDRIMKQIEREYSVSAFFWILVFGFALIFQVCCVVLFKCPNMDWFITLFHFSSTNLIIIFLSEVSHSAQANHRSAQRALRDLNLRLWKAELSPSVRTDIEMCVKNFSRDSFSLNLGGIFTLDRTTFVTAIMHLVTYSVILYQFRG